MVLKLSYKNICLSPCLLFSHILSGLHYFFARLDFLDIPACIREAPGGLYKNLQKIWFARLLKKIVSIWVRSPFRSQALRLVNFSLPLPSGNGLILVTCHTPWKRLLVQWFFENHYALIVDTGRSVRRKNRLQNLRKGHNELLHIIRHLRYGGQVIIAADVFNKSNDQPAEILGKPGNLSLLPVRLARIAGVPLMAGVPVLRNGRIEIEAGPLIDQDIPCSEMRAVMQKILGFFEQEIKNDPSIWSYFVNDSLSGFHKKIIK
jgi:lauroyl/myristoyl acyltransferase